MHCKWSQLLKEIALGVTWAAIMFNPKTALPHNLEQFEASAPSFSVMPVAAPVHDATEIESALSVLTREPGGGLIVMQDIFTSFNRRVIIAAAARYRVPAV